MKRAIPLSFRWTLAALTGAALALGCDESDDDVGASEPGMSDSGGSQTGGAPAVTGGASSGTGGAAAATGGAPAVTGGAPAVTGGAPVVTGGASSGTGGAAVATGGDGGSDPAPSYPAGPYGKEVGDVMPPLAWTGYVNTSGVDTVTLPVSDYGTAALHAEAAPFALVHISESWCPACRTTATVLGQRGEEIAAAGGLAVEILVQGDELASWSSTYDLEVTVVTPADGQTISLIGPRENIFIVDLATMEIVYRDQGIYEADIASAIDALLALLAG